MNNNINLLNIIPSYSCNLKCPHCFFLHLRDGKQIKPFKLENVLKKLSNEGVSNDISFEWYGGEVTILDYTYFSRLFEVAKKIFPFSRHSVVSNLVALNSDFLSFFRDNFTHITTSFENLRFSKNSLFFSIWRKNVELLSRDIDVTLIIMANPNVTEDTLKVLANMPFSRVSIYPIKVPENAPEKVNSRILKYALNIEETRKMKKLSEKIFGKERMASVQENFKIWNVLHIFPDGSYGIPAPSEKGFPFEKTITFSGNSIIYSPERIKYIAEQKTACVNCSDIYCDAEFKYKGFCVKL